MVNLLSPLAITPKKKRHKKCLYLSLLPGSNRRPTDYKSILNPLFTALKAVTGPSTNGFWGFSIVLFYHPQILEL